MARAPPMRLASLTHPSTIMLRCRQIPKLVGVDGLAAGGQRAGGRRRREQRQCTATTAAELLNQQNDTNPY
jgi:hypothetical protein